jgi:hypothetical protein
MYNASDISFGIKMLIAQRTDSLTAICLNFSFAGHYTFVSLIIKNTLPEDECSGNQCSPEYLSEDYAT